MSEAYEVWKGTVFDILAASGKQIDQILDVNSDPATLFRCVREVTEQLKRRDERPAFLDQYGTKAVSSLTILAKEYIENNDQEMTVLALSTLEIFNRDIAVDDNVQALVRLALFHANVRVRDSIQPIIFALSTEDQIKLLLPLYEIAATHNCVQFFVLLAGLAKKADFKNEIWDASVNQLFLRYSLPGDASGLERLAYALPKPQFGKGLLRVLLIILPENEVHDPEKLFNFLVEVLLLSEVRYFDSQDELYQLIKGLMLKIPALQAHLLQSLCEMNVSPNVQPNQARLSSVALHKGMRNLGATCYINATLQQFYHVPEFRSMILAHPFEESGEQWPLEVQYLFAQLTFSPLTYVDPSPLVRIWKGWDGEVVNPHQQQDAVEFCQVFLDRIESVLPNLAQLFKGEIVHHISGVGDNSCYRKDVVESFVTFPLEVKDHLCIGDSLRTFMLPEKLEGQNQYFMEGPGKIDAESFSRVTRAPTILIVMLKRFNYNMSSGVCEKVNDKYIFQMTLDFTPVMENQDEQVTYELCGIVRHLGSAQGGHYISDVLLEHEWGTFNDEYFSWSSTDKITSSSFGGYHFVDEWDEELQKYVPTRQPINGSAYLLFYRRAGEHSVNGDVCASTVNEALQDRLLGEIKDILRSHVLYNQHFAELLGDVRCTDEFSKFLFTYLKIIIRDHVTANPSIDKETFQSFTNKFIEPVHQSECLASLILSDVDAAFEFLVKVSDKETRQTYLLIISEGSLVAPIHVRKQFLSMCLNKVLTDGDEFMMYYANFDSFFRIFMIMHDHADEETWPAVFFNFLLTSVLDFSENSERQDMLRNVNLTSVFEILRELMVKTNRQKCFEAQVFDATFVQSFMMSSKHAKAFIDFLLVFQLQLSDVIKFMNLCEGLLTPASASGFIVLICYLSERSFDSVLSFLNKKSPAFVETCLDELSRRARRFNGSLAKNFAKLIEGLVEQYLVTQEQCLRMSMVEVVHALQMDPTDMYVILTAEFENVVKLALSLAKEMSDGYLDVRSHYFPTGEYLDLLQDAIVAGNLQQFFVDQYASITFDALKKFGKLTIDPNYPRDRLVLFVIDCLGSTYAEYFFDVVSFNGFLNTLGRMVDDTPKSAELLVKLLQFIPLKHIDVFFRNSLFSLYSRVMFLDLNAGRKIKEYILRRTHPGNAVDIASRLWELECLRVNIHSCGYEFFGLSWSLLRRFPATSDCFWNKQIHESCMRILSNDVYLHDARKLFLDPALAKLLAVFNEAYMQHNQGKWSLFAGDYVKVLDRFYENVKLHLFFASATAQKEPIPKGKCGFFQLIMSWMKLNKRYATLLFTLIEKSESGCVWNLPLFAHRRASEMIALACTLSGDTYPKDRIYKLVHRELAGLVHAPVCASIKPLCGCMVSLIDRETSPEVVQLIEQILAESPTPPILGSLSALMLAIVKVDASVAARWCEIAVAMLPSLIREADLAAITRDADTVLSFIMRVTAIAPVDVSPPPSLDLLKNRLGNVTLPSSEPAIAVLARIFPHA